MHITENGSTHFAVCLSLRQNPHAFVGCAMFALLHEHMDRTSTLSSAFSRAQSNSSGSRSTHLAAAAAFVSCSFVSHFASRSEAPSMLLLISSRIKFMEDMAAHRPPCSDSEGRSGGSAWTGAGSKPARLLLQRLHTYLANKLALRLRALGASSTEVGSSL